MFSNLPIYDMSLFKILAVRERLDRIRSYGDKRKLHLMRWLDVLKPTSVGALGNVSLEAKNWVLLAKWWRLGGGEWRCGEQLFLNIW